MHIAGSSCAGGNIGAACCSRHPRSPAAPVYGGTRGPHSTHNKKHITSTASPIFLMGCFMPTCLVFHCSVISVLLTWVIGEIEPSRRNVEMRFTLQQEPN